MDVPTDYDIAAANCNIANIYAETTKQYARIVEQQNDTIYKLKNQRKALIKLLKKNDIPNDMIAAALK